MPPRPLDRDLEGRIRAARSWRADYLGVLRELTIASAERASSLAIARAGLASMRSHLEFERDGRSVSLDQALEAFAPSLDAGHRRGARSSGRRQSTSRPLPGPRARGERTRAPARALDRRRRDRAVIRRGDRTRRRAPRVAVAARSRGDAGGRRRGDRPARTAVLVGGRRDRDRSSPARGVGAHRQACAGGRRHRAHAAVCQRLAGSRPGAHAPGDTGVAGTGGARR